MATEVQALFAELHAQLERENYQKAIDTCNKIRAKAPNDADAIRVKCQCLLRTGKFDKALEIALKADDLKMERAYCHYKLKQLDAVLKVTSTFPEPKPKAVLHLEAQAHYRLNNFDASIRIYEHLLSQANAAEDTVELKTNLVAAYIAAGRGAELQQRTLETEESYELAFNKSFVALQAQDVAGAADHLHLATKLCRDTLVAEGYSADEIAAEAATIRVQEAFLAQLGGDDETALAAYRAVAKTPDVDTSVVAVAQNNIAAIQRSKDAFDSLKRLGAISDETLSKCTATQHETILVNRVLVLLQLHKVDDAVAAVAVLAARFPNSDLLAPLQLHLALQADPANLNLAALAETFNHSTGGRLCLAHVHCRLGRPAAAADALRLIPSIQHTPGTVATLVALYDAALDAKSAAAVVDAATA
ncbi:hypothetical protein As57867_018008, partial [Aphanomyces stellatus]